METLENQTHETETNRNDEVHRIGVSKMAEEALMEVLERVNNGFEGGRINRTQMANWILVRFASQCSDTDIQQIRAENVNELAVLEAILKKARKTGKLPSDMSQLIHKHLGFQEPARKYTKSKLTKNIINDDMVEMEE
jgi:hypothetical protein